MKLETQKQIGENLKILRTSNCMSQSEIADIAGVSRALYAGYELGKRTPDAEVLFLISSRFEINMGIFFNVIGTDFLDTFRIKKYMTMSYQNWLQIIKKCQPLQKECFLKKHRVLWNGIKVSP